MLQKNKSGEFRGRASDRQFISNKRRSVKMADLVELFLEPLSAQVDRARLEIIGKIQELCESLEIMARQARRQIDNSGSEKGR